jgi:hypothetical protein
LRGGAKWEEPNEKRIAWDEPNEREGGGSKGSREGLTELLVVVAIPAVKHIRFIRVDDFEEVRRVAGVELLAAGEFGFYVAAKKTTRNQESQAKSNKSPIKSPSHMTRVCLFDRVDELLNEWIIPLGEQVVGLFRHSRMKQQRLLGDGVRWQSVGEW